MTVHRLVTYLMTILMMSFGGFAQALPVEDLCPKTSKSREWAATCFDTTRKGSEVKKQFRKNAVLNRQGYTAIVVGAPPELVSVNRHGKVVSLKKSHLTGFDFEPGGDEGDIARFGYSTESAEKKKVFKCGYYLSGKFTVLIPPIYDECDPFKNGSAKVCLGCVDHCDSDDCHVSDFVGGEGLIINDKNQILRRFKPPLLPRCSDESAKETPETKCRPQPTSPLTEIRGQQSLFNEERK